MLENFILILLLNELQDSIGKNITEIANSEVSVFLNMFLLSRIK
jgi:hypothetical protein